MSSYTIGAQVGSLTPPSSNVLKTPPSILFMPTPLENPLNNVLVQQMCAKMKKVHYAYGGIKYTVFLSTLLFLSLQGKILRLRWQYGNTADTLTAVNNPCYIHLVDTFTESDHFISPVI